MESKPVEDMSRDELIAELKDAREYIEFLEVVGGEARRNDSASAERAKQWKNR
jgi:hypothetical protein